MIVWQGVDTSEDFVERAAHNSNCNIVAVILEREPIVT